MSEGSYLHEIHNVTVIGIVEEALAYVRGSKIEEALNAIDRAVIACESHPSYARFASSECKSIDKLIWMCLRLVSDGGPAGGRAQALLDRMHLLGRSELH